MNNRQCYFIYPRDNKNKFTGITICVMLYDNKIFHGTAVCSKNDNFDKKIGRQLALERANKTIERYKESKAINSYLPEQESENLLGKLVTLFTGK